VRVSAPPAKVQVGCGPHALLEGWCNTDISVGYEEVTLEEYGRSADPQLDGMERHGNSSVSDGLPSVVIAEGVRGRGSIAHDAAIGAWIEHDFLRHVRAGH